MKMTGFYDVSLTTPQRPHSRHPRGQLTQKAGLGCNPLCQAELPVH